MAERQIHNLGVAGSIPAPAPTSAAAAAAPAPRRRLNGAFLCYPGSTRGRIQGLLAQHYPVLWAKLEEKWLPSARPIPPPEPGQPSPAYERATLAEVLIGMGEAGRAWDGYEVCDLLQHVHGWRCDFHLASLIHAWSTQLHDRLRS